MMPAFEDVLSEMEPLFRKLVGAERISFDGSKKIPNSPGVYLLSESEVNLYVGRSSKSLRNRLKGHRVGTHYSSSFAFLLAREETKIAPTYKKEGSRPALMNHPVFRPAFDRAIDRVKKMDVRCIELDDDYQQYLLELYAALKLRTPHNHFRTS